MSSTDHPTATIGAATVWHDGTPIRAAVIIEHDGHIVALVHGRRLEGQAEEIRRRISSSRSLGDPALTALDAAIRRAAARRTPAE